MIAKHSYPVVFHQKQYVFGCNFQFITKKQKLDYSCLGAISVNFVHRYFTNIPWCLAIGLVLVLSELSLQWFETLSGSFFKSMYHIYTGSIISNYISQTHMDGKCIDTNLVVDN